jgi:hypothetical protein
MIDAEKCAHPWRCDLSRGDEQCPFVTPNGTGFLSCVWRSGHPESLPHEAYYDQPNGPQETNWVQGF